MSFIPCTSPAQPEVQLLMKMNMGEGFLLRLRGERSAATVPFPGPQVLGLRKGTREFVVTGSLDGMRGYDKASMMLDMTQLKQKYNIQPYPLLRRLYISQEFLRTVKTANTRLLDDFTISISSTQQAKQANSAPATGELGPLEHSG